MQACLVPNSIVYLHGFQSSSRSQKAKAFEQFLQADERYRAVRFISPDLPFSPQKTVDKVSDILQEHPDSVLMGSSMGGFYAAYFSKRFAVPAVLINPLVDASDLFHAYVGQRLFNSYTGESYLFQQQDLAFLRAMNKEELSRPELMFMLLETGDEILDYRLAEKRYRICPHRIIEGGNHRFESFESCLPDIMAYYGKILGKEHV